MKYALAVMSALPNVLAAQDLDCENPVSQIEMTGCASKAYEAADADLNLAWKIAMSQARRMDQDMDYDPTNADLLRDAQRKWIAFRDAACTAESTLMRGGSAQNMLYLGCLEKLTRQRTEDLRYFGEVN